MCLGGWRLPVFDSYLLDLDGIVGFFVMTVGGLLCQINICEMFSFLKV